MPSQRPEEPNPYPWYSLTFWYGMRPLTWWRMCARHGFRIHPLRWPMAFLVGLLTPINTVMGLLQHVLHGRRIAATEVRQPPVFIIGHWRSGTTYLHELMHLDERFVAPTTYQCFAPHHCLLTAWMMETFGSWLIPRQRPMDNMAAGWDRPQEDEFALLTLGAPTPYQRMAFPNDRPPYMELLDMRACATEDVARFEQTIVHFVKLLTYSSERRVLLKSPPHTGRIEVLARLFPGARFIHLVRHPFALFPSTMRLWQSLDAVQGLQMPNGCGLDEYVFDCLTRMYAGFEDQRKLLDPDAVYQLRYEDLIKNPVAEIGRIYEALELGDYSVARDKVAAFAAAQKDYKPNRFQVDDALQARIRERWGGYFERYGYG